MTIGLDRFKILEVLLRTRSPSNAALELGITQSAASKALAQLRVQMKDQLLVRRGDRMILTPRAERIFIPLSAALSRLSALANNEDEHQRPTSLKIAMRDQFAMALAPAILRVLAEESPATALHIMPYDRERLADLLMQGAIDAAVAVDPPDVPGLMGTLLYNETFVCLTSDPEPPTLEDYLAARHIVVSAHSAFSGVDSILREVGLERKIAVRVPYFAAAIHMAEMNKLFLTLPKSVANTARVGALHEHPTPITVPGFAVSLVWDSRCNDDPANKWIRTIIRDAVRSGQNADLSR